MQRTGNEFVVVTMATSKINIVFNMAGNGSEEGDMDITDKIPIPTEKPNSFIPIVESIESTVDSTICVNEPGFSGATTTSRINEENIDEEVILDHAGWAIKRARDIIDKGHDELAAKETVAEDAHVLYANKTDALAIISLLGQDVKQPDELYRFCVNKNVLPFFLFLHNFVESMLSRNNILREKGNILKYCLEQMSVHEDLRRKWNELLPPDTDATTSVVVLQRIVTFFLKSKQQIFREKEGLKPNKKSFSLRQQVKGSSKSNITVNKYPTPSVPKIPSEILTLRSDFTPPTVEAFLRHLKTLLQDQQQALLGALQGKELAKILKGVGKPAFLGKKKDRQIKSLIEAIQEGAVKVQFPDNVSTNTIKHLHLFCMLYIIHTHIYINTRSYYRKENAASPPRNEIQHVQFAE